MRHKPKWLDEAIAARQKLIDDDEAGAAARREWEKAEYEKRKALDAIRYPNQRGLKIGKP